MSPLAVGLVTAPVSAALGVLGTLLSSAFRERRRLRFRMSAKIEPLNVHPREQLTFSFLNVGRTPVHIERIEGDRGFSFGDYLDPITLDVSPEPYQDDVPASFVRFLETRPTRVVAVDSRGKRWKLPRRDLKTIYRVLEAHKGVVSTAMPAREVIQTRLP